MNSFLLWLAQGLGVGRLPRAPGSFGSLLGLGWFALLLAAKSPGVFLAGVVVSVPVSIWLGGVAEKILQQTDPGSVVIDEIIALPFCFAGWLVFLYFEHGLWPSADYFFSRERWLATCGVFLLFRIFDVTKPWPIRQSQSLSGGWGVTVDDLLAAGYVNAVIIAVLLGKSL